MNKLINKYVKKYNLDIRIIREICYSPFKFANKRMADPLDKKAIMFAYLFKIRLRKYFRYDKTRKLTEIKNKR